ncbi:hypothetical protein [Variovorax fucosicus]|uniref:hypothetical protein n=1 Tax=Variovorax fucosicus TaxID=3053517 RepID=UPI002578EC75|nr:hypothetical protein [Variovorax sp. J22G47]MDM0059010.1 hypothetical protein [Variovorax sp. J22G47]
MDLLQILVGAFGGGAAALAVVAFLGKTLISHQLSLEMENQKGRLKAEGDQQVEILKARLLQVARVDDRTFELEQVMRRYQGPLLHAVYDLQSRLYNILNKRFFDTYLGGGTPQQMHYAKYNTAFLVAQYFGWTEIIRLEVQFIELGEDAKTRKLSQLRDEIYSLWQTDRFNDPLMIWAGEQRGIGELMIEKTGEQLTCKGYASFLKSFSSGHEQLLNHLIQAVQASGQIGSHSHDRLREIQHKLIDMLEVLDPKGIRFNDAARTKA